MNRIQAMVAAAALIMLSACNIPETRQVKWDDKTPTLKELYSAYDEDGQEVKHGLMIKFNRQGEKVAEIYYEHGEPVSYTVFDKQGRPLAVENLALIEEKIDSGS